MGVQLRLNFNLNAYVDFCTVISRWEDADRIKTVYTWYERYM